MTIILLENSQKRLYHISSSKWVLVSRTKRKFCSLDCKSIRPLMNMISDWLAETHLFCSPDDLLWYFSVDCEEEGRTRGRKGSEEGRWIRPWHVRRGGGTSFWKSDTICVLECLRFLRRSVHNLLDTLKLIKHFFNNKTKSDLSTTFFET